jgi:hypothetical protein
MSKEQERINELQRQYNDLVAHIDEIRLLTGSSSTVLAVSVRALKRDADRYRYLRGADPDTGPYIGLEQQTDWGNWNTQVILSKVADALIDKAIKEHV